MSEDFCGYENWDYEGERCELPYGHEGKHRFVLEWDTRLEDVCRAEGHVWDEWQAYTKTKPSLFVSLREWKVEPERWRRCDRCKHLEFEGGERLPSIADFLWQSLYVQPVPPGMPAEVVEKSSKWEFDLK